MELPEVEVMRRDLERDVVGKKIKDAEVKSSRNAMRTIRRHKTRKEFTSRLAGRKITKIERRGKYLLLYLDLGLDAARELIERLFEPRMEAYVRGEGDRDYKTTLQELASQELRALPVYQIQDRGPDHQKEFTATVVIAGETLGTGVGRSKKEAEQQAAREAHARISERRAARPMGGSVHGAS